jgi:hypothetical protein
LAIATPGSTVAATGTCEATLRLPARDYGGVTLDASEAAWLEGAVIDRPKGLHIRGGRRAPASGSFLQFLAEPLCLHESVLQQMFIQHLANAKNPQAQ